ncbi:MAG: leucine--tRNA ligase [Candidatus Rehaiarchaeum fermentans]|nr:leucine--tRNA ligase [Candidatus Rehaiarchaeum fermentans]
MDIKEIDKKWIKEFEKISQPTIDRKKEKYFITVPIPYPDGPLHLGHAYTWGRADIRARFKRMQGYNVLFPQGFHLTGGPLVGMSIAIKNKDEKLLHVFKDIYKVDDKKLNEFEDPQKLGFYFADEIKKEFEYASYTIDWRKEFRTTDIRFQKFVEWQFKKLKEKGLVYKGTHPVIWCPREGTALGDHDRSEGEGESPVEFTIIKFYLDKLVLPISTLRPETIFGCTNLWVNPKLHYKKLKVNGEYWIVAEESVIKLKNQLKKIEEEEDFDINTILNKMAKDNINNKEIPIYAADFVTSKGTGIVMSVPAHAPFDYFYLKKIDPNANIIKVIEVEGEDDLVQKSLQLFGTSQKGLEEATKYVYRIEDEKGIIISPRLKGMSVKEARQKVIEILKEKGVYDKIYDTINPVVCRCKAQGIVKIVEDQWFIKYSDEDWKRKCLELLNGMKIYPEEAKNLLIASILSLEDKACTRSGKKELGTKFPWDKTQVIEPLSDSTIYMAYYTIADIIKEVPEEKINDDLFDFVFLEKDIELDKEIKEVALKMREAFNYWYPVDVRISAKELIPNHLTFFLMNHAIMFPPNKWPRAIEAHGWLTINEIKMSKSKGNGILIDEFVKENGIDKLRIIACLGNGIDDEEFSLKELKAFDQKIDLLASIIEMMNAFDDSKIKVLDDYLKSLKNQLIMKVTDSLENFRYRNALYLAFYQGIENLRTYIEMGGKNKEVISDYIFTLIKLIHPIFPSITEDFAKVFDKRLLESYKSWPEPNIKEINKEVENEFQVFQKTIEDIKKLIERFRKEPKKIEISIAKKEDFEIVNKIVELRDKEISLKEIEKIEGAKKYLKNINELRNYDYELEKEVFNELKEYLAKIFNASVEIKESNEKAIPGRPGLNIIWK